MYTITVNNFKGGSGKTTTVISIAYRFSQNGLKVLLLDLDPQANLSIKFGLENAPGISELLDKTVDIKEAVHATFVKNIDLIPAKIELIDSAERLYKNSQIALIKKKIEILSNDYDVAIIDNSPMMPILFTNSIFASNLMIIPSTIDSGSIKGINYTISKINDIIDNSPLYFDIDYIILPTMVQMSKGQPTVICRQIINLIKDKYQENLSEVYIRSQHVPIARQSLQKDYFIDECGPGKDYADFCTYLCDKKGI